MKRYTEKSIENEYTTSNVLLNELKIDDTNKDKDYILEQQKNIIDTLDQKLGKLEDLMEKYHIRDVEHLDRVLEEYKNGKYWWLKEDKSK